MLSTRFRARAALSIAALGTAAVLWAAPAYAGGAQVSPTPVKAGDEVDIVAQCSTDSTSASISAATLGGASNVPMLASTKNPGEWTVTLTVPMDTLPGTYDLGGTCQTGSGFTATVVVSTTTGPMGGGGWAMGGPDQRLLVLGMALLAAAGAGGLALLRRRA